MPGMTVASQMMTSREEDRPREDREQKVEQAERVVVVDVRAAARVVVDPVAAPPGGVGNE